MAPKSSKSSKADKGCVGFLYGGIMKVEHVRVFTSDESDPSEVAQEFANQYGEVNYWYAVTESPTEQFEKFSEALDAAKRLGTSDIFNVTTSEAKTTLKDATELPIHSFSLKKKEAKTKKEGDDQSDEEKDDKKKSASKKDSKKESKKEAKKDESESESSDDEAEKPKKKKAVKGKKDESGDEKDSSSEDEKEVKKGKKKPEEDDDEGPKLKKKGDKEKDSKDSKDSKSSKSKSSK